MEFGLQRIGDGICLDAVADTEARHGAENCKGEGHPGPAPAESVLDVVHGATDVVALLVHLAVLHRQHRLGILGGHADEGRAPHPEQGPGAADGDGRADTGDVARADRRGQGCHQGIEGGDVTLALLPAAGPQHPKPITDASQRHEAQAEHQDQPGAENQQQHRRAPGPAVDCAHKIRDCFHDIPLLKLVSEAARGPIYKAQAQASRCYLRQNCGVNRMSTEKISNRPMSMVKLHTQVW